MELMHYYLKPNITSMRILRNIYFAIFDSHLYYSCIAWTKSINAVSKLIIYSSEQSTTNINFKDQVFHSSEFFSAISILKSGDKTT